MKSLRIAMLAACPFPAAFASSGLIRELSMALMARGHDIHIICYHLGVAGFPVDQLRIHRIPPVPFYRKISSGISPGKPYLDFLLTRQILKLMKSMKFDLIHAHNYEAPLAGYAARYFYGTPVIYHAHNTMWHELPSYFSNQMIKKIAGQIGRALDLHIPRRADHVIALSEEQREYLLGCGVDKSKITIVEPAISMEFFAQGDRTRIRRQLRIGNDPLIIYTGGLQPYQNCRILPEVLRHVHRMHPSAHLLILARSESNDLRQLAVFQRVDDRMHFIEGAGLAVEQDCLAAADIAIIPRRHCIGFPIKIINYIAAHKPVVCYESLIENFPKMIEVEAARGDRAEDLAAVAIQLLSDEAHRKNISCSAQKKIIEHYQWDDRIEEIESVYRQVLNHRNYSPGRPLQ